RRHRAPPRRPPHRALSNPPLWPHRARAHACVQWMQYMTDMHAVHMGALDLNLLVALDALLAEKSVTRAAERVGITQSAMSHALARLRSMIGDVLLVRTSTGMVPTARAEAMAPALHDALDAVARALA